jgi:hypothetical protein
MFNFLYAEKCPIHPDNIDTNNVQKFYPAFGRSAQAVSAWWLVKFCQAQKSWSAFSIEDLDKYYLNSGSSYFSFNGLDYSSVGFLILQDKLNPYSDLSFAEQKTCYRDRYTPTIQFVLQCYQHCPKF